MNSANLCLQCKGGKALCGHSICPLLSKIEFIPKISEQMNKTEFFGPSTSIFVGYYGYPQVNIGPVGALGFAEKIDQPQNWFGMDYNTIIEMRSMALRSKTKQHVKSKSRFVQENQLLAMANNSPDVEMNFKKKPTYRFSFSDVTQPMGPSAELDKMKLIDNVHISRKVDYIVHDDLKAAEQCYSMYQVGVDIHKVMNILSSGALGVDENQKMVPTKWSITAFDDLVTKKLLENVRTSFEIKEIQTFESEYLGNHFIILLIPGKWEFENFEAWSPGSTWALDAKETQMVGEYEPFEGRTTYAKGQSGGYYASRFSIVEYLHNIKRQARVVAFREISEKYVVPLGVWLVRSCVKHAFDDSPTKFSSLKEALTFISSKLKLPIHNYLKDSKILCQTRLLDFSTLA
jgi:hypothetical protein